MAPRRGKRMPRRISKKRVWRKRKPTITVNRALNPVPQRTIVKMKYSEAIVTTAAGLYQFNLNSVYDPNRSGVGHQPYAYDTFTTLYNRYRVIATGYRIQGVTSYNGTPYQVAVQPANEVLSPTSVNEMKENPRSKYITVSPGAGATILKGKVYIPSLVGRNKQQYMSDDRYQALTTADPNELAVLNIKTSSMADVDLSAQLNVLLEYTVEFFDVKHLVQS